MLLRYKGVVATLDEWESTTRIIPDEIWAVVIFEGTEEAPISVGLKLGVGKRFADTPYIAAPNMWIPRPDTDAPRSNYFLSEDGNYYPIDPGGCQCDLDEILAELEDRGLEIPTKEEVEWIREQMYKTPVIVSFTSVSPFIGAVEMGTVIEGAIPLQWNISEQPNVETLTLEVSEGSWEGTGNVESPKMSTGTSISAVSPITSKNIKTITYTLYGTDRKGKPIAPKTLSTVFTHRIHYGTVSSRTITSFAEITGRRSVLSNSRRHTLDFIPNGSQYSIVLIPVEIDQQGINIVNSNASNIDHSYGMNDGTRGTTSQFTVVDNGILYNAYVSYNPSFGPSSAIIK